MLRVKFFFCLLLIAIQISALGQDDVFSESFLMNRTAHSLGMHSCEAAKIHADSIFNLMKTDVLDSAYYFNMGDPMYSEKETVLYDSIVFERYKLIILHPGHQPILECYKKRLDSLMREEYRKDVLHELWLEYGPEG